MLPCPYQAFYRVCEHGKILLKNFPEASFFWGGGGWGRKLSREQRRALQAEMPRGFPEESPTNTSQRSAAPCLLVLSHIKPSWGSWGLGCPWVLLPFLTLGGVLHLDGHEGALRCRVTAQGVAVLSLDAWGGGVQFHVQ